MQQLKKLYRNQYTGENVITKLTLENAEWNPEAELVPNSVFSTHTTTQAIVIGNGESRLDFDLTHIANHKAGLGGADRLQSYGCNALYRDYNSDFLIATGDDMVAEIANSGYCNNNIVYANGDALLKHTGKFYLVPQNVYYDAGSLAAYMACFDGHKKVYLLGFDSYHNTGPHNNVYKGTNAYPPEDQWSSNDFFTSTLYHVMTTYSDVDFIRVMPTNTWWWPDSMLGLLNARTITFRDFVLEADIG